jgi:hypothetical protein
VKTTTDTPEVQEPKSDKKSPGFWFYTADYERDMQILSLSSQGLWSRMLCWMSENEAHRGFAELPTGEPMGVADIAAKVGKASREVEKCLSEMARIGTYSIDDRRCYYCRRMARDTHISTVRKAAAKSRMETSKRAADGSFAGNFDGTNRPAKEEQKPTVTASVSVSVSDSLQEPPKPPAPNGADTEENHVPFTAESQGVVRHDVFAEEKEPTTADGKQPRSRRANRTTEEIKRALNSRLPWWEEFWKIYPRHDAMNPTMNAYERSVADHDKAVMLWKGAKNYAAKAAADPEMLLAMGATWIHQERWLDEAQQTVTQPKSIYTKG